MMAKKPVGTKKSGAKTSAPAEPEGDKPKRPDRAGTRLVAAHMDEAKARQLKVLAAVSGTTVHALLHEAVDLLFKEHADQMRGFRSPRPRRRTGGPAAG